MTTKDDGVMRSFTSGATRDTGEGKLDFDGFFHPDFIEQFAKYMNMNRLQSDGQTRDSDNWQKGIGSTVCRKSMWRHFFETWKILRIYHDLFTGATAHVDMPREDIIELVAGMMGQVFNIQMILVNLLRKYPMVDFDGDEPTDEMKERQEKIANKEPEGYETVTFPNGDTADRAKKVEQFLELTREYPVQPRNGGYNFCEICGMGLPPNATCPCEPVEVKDTGTCHVPGTGLDCVNLGDQHCHVTNPTGYGNPIETCPHEVPSCADCERGDGSTRPELDSSEMNNMNSCWWCTDEKKENFKPIVAEPDNCENCRYQLRLVEQSPCRECRLKAEMGEGALFSLWMEEKYN